MNSKEPRYYYHITENKNWGQSIILSPRSNGPNRDVNEPDTPRICVCPTIEQCFIAINVECEVRWYIYRTEQKEIATHPIRIPDSYITDERWLRKKTKFIKLGSLLSDKLPFKKMGDINLPALGDGEDYSEQWQKKFLRLLRKGKLFKKFYKESR